MPLVTKKIMENKSLIGYKILSLLNIKQYDVDNLIITKDNKLSQLSDYQTIINYVSQQIEQSEKNHKDEKIKLKQILLSALNKLTPIYQNQVAHQKYDTAISNLVNKQMSDFEKEVMAMEVNEELVILLQEKSERIKRILNHAKKEREKLINEQKNKIEIMQKEINTLKEKVEKTNKVEKTKAFNAAAIIVINEVDIIDKKQHPDIHQYILHYVSDIISKMQKKFPYIVIENNNLQEYALFFDNVSNEMAYKITSEFKTRINNIKITYKNEKQKISTTGGFFHAKEKIAKDKVYEQANIILTEAKAKNEGSIMKNVVI